MLLQWFGLGLRDICLTFYAIFLFFFPFFLALGFGFSGFAKQCKQSHVLF